MLLECEKCNSKFNLDENLIPENGSKVRCSVCKHVFTVLPPEEDDEIDPALEETVALDSPPELDDETEATPENNEEDFDKAFEDALQDDIEKAVEEETLEPETKSEPPAKKREKKGPGLLLIILVFVLTIASGAICVYLFAPSLLPDNLSGMQPIDEEEMTDTGNRRLDIGDLNSNFIPTDKMGQLFIIKGKIINNYPTSRSYILLKGTIEDENKKSVGRKLAYVGNIFTEHELKEMTREEIEKGMANKTGENNSNLNVEPNASVPFMIIFYDLPDNLSEFLVETISSSPAN